MTADPQPGDPLVHDEAAFKTMITRWSELQSEFGELQEDIPPFYGKPHPLDTITEQFLGEWIPMKANMDACDQGTGDLMELRLPNMQDLGTRLGNTEEENTGAAGSWGGGTGPRV